MLRKYRCATVDCTASDRSNIFGLGPNRPASDALVIVTSKRVIFYTRGKEPAKATGLPPMHLQEAFVDSICSTEFVRTDMKKSATMPLALTILGILLTVGGLVGGFMSVAVPGVILLAVGVLALVLSMIRPEPLVTLRIATSASESGIHVSGASRKEESEISFAMIPGDEFENMANEIGAIIVDLQENGEACIDRWVQ
ncbi:MAG: hypothetical protein IJ856_06795 [Candidatus Methanomethylophilaceae archaeon]|nr:hypothetical protein [Candidatus Methanomethylophilaceae archaeon]